MTNSFTSLEQIKAMFDIIEATPEAVRDSLRRKQAAIHPDHSEGKFARAEDEKLILGDILKHLDVPKRRT